MSSSNITLYLSYAGHTLTLDSPRVMGILNITNDSFSDGGKFLRPRAAVHQAVRMLEEGADIIDIGAESTRPGASEVGLQQELDRLLPVVEELVGKLGALVSVDTSKTDVMREVLNAGAFMINDVRALRDYGAVELLAAVGAPVCIMHMQGDPKNMQNNPAYSDVVSEVTDFLCARRQACVDAGIAVHNVVLDPGFGFGKTLQHNLCLLKNLHKMTALEAPILAGLSRKRMFAAILNDESVDRTQASVAAALLAVDRGAHLVRVHDVLPTVQALQVQSAMNNFERM